MKYELSPDATKDLDDQLEKSDEDSKDNDPVKQTLDVPKGGDAEDAAEKVQKQYEDKSGLKLDSDVADDIVEETRKNSKDESSDDKSGKDESNADESGKGEPSADESAKDDSSSDDSAKDDSSKDDSSKKDD